MVQYAFKKGNTKFYLTLSYGEQDSYKKMVVSESHCDGDKVIVESLVKRRSEVLSMRKLYLQICQNYVNSGYQTKKVEG